MPTNPLTSLTTMLPIPGQKKAEPEPALTEAQQIAQGMVSLRDILAPSAMEVDFSYVHINDTFYRTIFISGYPRQVGANWLSPIINFGTSLDISMFYYPISTKLVLKKLRRKITEMQAEIMTEEASGKLLDPSVELNLQDAAKLQDELVEGSEKFFQFALYITIPAPTLDELNSITRQVETALGGMLMISKPTTLQMVEGFKSTLPTFEDALQVTRNMDTTSLATTFPFTSSELTANEGVMYGLNEHNGSLVVFDRFNLENANMVIFAKSGAGKSYAVKLEAMRSLMLGAEVIVIDPENEYKTMASVIGGSYIPFDFTSNANINPFDLSTVYDSGENELGLKILNLHSLIKVMFGDLNPTEEAVLDRALVLTYKLKGITPDPDTQKNEPPLLEDLYKVFLGMEEREASGLADRLERYVKGSAAGLFDKPSNINLNNTFTVFGIRDLEDSIRPVAMFVILDYIWTHIRRSRKKRLLVIDEAWFLMQNPDSAKFVSSVARRARKYYLGLTTITQNVEDFLGTDLGKVIVSSSSLQFLMKQSTSSVDKLTEVFYLSSGEKNLLLSANVGEGLFFAGSAHVALQVIASPDEHRLITTNPRELQAIADAEEANNARIASLFADTTGETSAQQVVNPDSTGLIDVPVAVPALPEVPVAAIDAAPAEVTAAVPSPTADPTVPFPAPPAVAAGTDAAEADLAAAPLPAAPVQHDTRIGSPDLPLPKPSGASTAPAPLPVPPANAHDPMEVHPASIGQEIKDTSTDDGSGSPYRPVAPSVGSIDIFDGGTAPPQGSVGTFRLPAEPDKPRSLPPRSSLQFVEPEPKR